MRKPIYFPSCNFSAASPETAKKIRDYLAQTMDVAGCCRVDESAYKDGAHAVYFCQACREMIEAKMGQRMTNENLLVYLDHDESFVVPNHAGLTVTVQDCYRDRSHPEIFDAVRSLLTKMNVTVVEMQENREHSGFCGNLHFEPKKAENFAIVQKYGDTPIWQYAPEDEAALMREQAEKLPCELAVCYCNRCVKGIRTGGGKAVHILDLLFE